jgi:ketosteroid isomerase-like protein
MADESTTPDLVELGNRLTDAGNRRDLDEIMAFFTPDAVWDASPMGTASRPSCEGVRAWSSPRAIIL